MTYSVDFSRWMARRIIARHVAPPSSCEYCAGGRGDADGGAEPAAICGALRWAICTLRDTDPRPRLLVQGSVTRLDVD